QLRMCLGHTAPVVSLASVGERLLEKMDRFADVLVLSAQDLRQTIRLGDDVIRPAAQVGVVARVGVADRLEGVVQSDGELRGSEMDAGYDEVLYAEDVAVVTPLGVDEDPARELQRFCGTSAIRQDER